MTTKLFSGQEVETKAKALDPAPAINPLLLTPEEAGAALNVGRTRLYELLRDGALQSVTIGRSRRIPVRAIDECVDLLCSTTGNRQ